MSVRTPIVLSLILIAGTLGGQQRDEIAVELSQDDTLSEMEPVKVPDEFVRAAKFGTRYFELGELSSAYERFQEANAIVPNHPSILYNMAVVLVKMGRYAEAEEKIQTYLSLFPDGAESAYVKNLQIDLDFQRDRQKKQQSNQSYIELFNRGTYAYEQGNWDEALSLFQQAEQLRSEDAAAIYNQALAYEATGNYEKATERLRQYLAVTEDISAKAEIDHKIFQLETEMETMKSSFVCSFCGHRLPIGATWCHRCWHGPYLPASPQLNTLPCGVGASATRTSLYSDDRLAKNETIDCRIKQTNMLEQVRYSKGRQRAIQEARKAEGWTYRDDVITALEQEGSIVIELIQGDHLETLLSRSSGDALAFSATARGENDWLLDREEMVIDGQKYVKTYQYDPQGTIVAERVTYQNDAACGHVIETKASYVREAGRLIRVDFEGNTTGFEFEGLPKTTWNGAITWSYDSQGRISREVFEVTKQEKLYTERPRGPMRDEVKRLYPQFRPGKSLDILRKGDLCAMVGNRPLGNPIDLRPFASVSPNLAVQVTGGVVKISVDYTYPAGFELPVLTGGR